MKSYLLFDPENKVRKCGRCLEVKPFHTFGMTGLGDGEKPSHLKAIAKLVNPKETTKE